MTTTLLKSAFTLFALSAGANLSAQTYIDRYLTQTPVYTTIGTSGDGLDQPQDLDFKPNTSELWVINKANNMGGSTVTYYNAGESEQKAEYRKDTHSDHFMSYPTAIAFADNGDWACTNETQNGNFMGPALWSGDTAIYARVFQNSWAVGYPLGSHTDMLHQSPYAMGIAHDNKKAYWIADGQHGNICKYDFVVDHGPGYDDHSAGKIWRYTDITISRLAGVPGHMVLDTNSKWLYVVNAGTKQLFRMNTSTGNISGNLVAPNEYLASYQAVTGASKEILDTYTGQPCGIDLYGDRLIVGDYQTGEIRVYDIAGAAPVFKGTIATGQSGIMGLKIGHDGKIWFVNKDQNKVVRMDLPAAGTDIAVKRILSPVVYNFEPGFYSTDFNYCANFLAPEIEIANTGAVTVTSLKLSYVIDSGVVHTLNWMGSLAAGATETIALGTTQVSDGNHKIVVFASMPNGTADQNEANDTREGSFRSKGTLAPATFHEGFDAAVFPPAGWTYIGYNRYCKMSREASYGSYVSDKGCLKMNNTTGQENISGQVDYIISPRIDLTNSGSGTVMDFEIAHVQYSSTSNDKLDLLISKDCGSTWHMVFGKSGVDLATAQPSTSVFYPEYFHWRTEIVDLGAYVGNEIMFMFKTTSDFGNNLYIDNINIQHVPVGVEEWPADKLQLFPNPANGIVELRLPGQQIESVQVFNTLGMKISASLISADASGQIKLNMAGQAAGTYFVAVTSKNGSTVKKLIVQH